MEPVQVPSPWTVFLDRDGVFCRLRLPGVRHERDFEWLPGVREAFARLNRPDVRTCLVTNQPQVGHLLAMPGHVRRVHEHLLAELEDAGGRLDRIEVSYSPVWFPNDRRKPGAGMMMSAARAWARAGSPVERDRAVMVGDTVKDARAARTFGIPCILLATTYTRETLERRLARTSVEVWAIEDGLPEAVERILAWIDDPALGPS